MSNVNLVIQIGRLTRPPEKEVIASTGTEVSKFTVANSKKIKGEDRSEFHNIKAFGKTAEICNAYLRKASLVYIEGELTTSSWEKEGTKHYRTEIIANKVQFLSPKGEVKRDESGEPVHAEAQFADSSDSIPF